MVNALLVIAKERNKSIMTGMAKLTGHHWITHSAIVILLFFGIGALLTRVNGDRGLRLGANRLIAIVVSGVVLAGLMIVGLYLIAD